jgi:hypothetical protein
MGVRRKKEMSKTVLSDFYCSKLLFVFVLCAAAFVHPAFVKRAFAGAPPAIASTPCDSTYYQTLSARAWLEAQREITQNQNLILKPDSVLEYTCFDMFLAELADHADEMFSETSQFGAPLSTTSMDNALENLVGTSLRNFVSANFGYYDMLGGHSAGVGINHTIPSPIAGGTYTCDMMNQVWLAAKCINFASNPAEDGFYTFQEYSTQPDKRYLPTRNCAAAPWAANISTALTSPPWTPDPMQTYLAFIDPNNCAAGNASNIAIPTGVAVTRTAVAPTSYNEHVCIIPGCRYDPAAPGCRPN